MENIKGNFLISTPQMPDPRFQKQVIYICSHNQEGAMGVVINNPSQDISMQEILHYSGLPQPSVELPPVYEGGPVEPEAGFLLYTSDYRASNCLEITDQISLSRESRILEDIARGKGPEHYLFLLGYAGWAPGQLEMELMDNSWLNLPSDLEVLFHTPDSLKWKRAAQKYGIDISMLSDAVGNA